MKKYLIIAFAAAYIYAPGLKAQIKMPAPSTTQVIKQDFGMGYIELTYSRPNIKGRKLLMENSELVPLGKLWRTGANAATRIHFSDKVAMGGHDLDSGTYVLYSIPNKNEWTIIINNGVKNWGTDYKQEEDVFRFTVPSMNYACKTETYTMNFANIKNESCDLQLVWGATAVNVPITTKITERLRAQIENALTGEKKPYQQAATFYYEMDRNYPKALDNINKAIGLNEKAFWLYMTKARIQNDMGDKAGAKESALKVVTLATEAKNIDYATMANDMLKKLK